MRRRSNLLVLLGLASFVLGLLAVYVITGDDDDGEETVAGSDTVEVLVASDNLAAGTLGDDIIAESSYSVERVAVAERQADALVTPSQLSGQALTVALGEGEQLRASALRDLGGTRAQIPEGHEAVALDVDFVAGGANTVVPGDRVNVFQVFNGSQVQGPDAGPELTQPRAELLMPNVLVLDVTPGEAPLRVSQTAQQGEATGTGGGNLIMVFAVSTADAEKVIFGSTAPGASLYLSRVHLDENGNPAPPAGPTGGVVLDNVLP